MTRLISILLLFCCGLATASLPRDAVRLREALTAVANNGQGVIQERDANDQAVGSVPLAGSFSPRASLFAAYRSMKDMRAAHASSGAKIYGAIVDLPTSWSRLSQTIEGAGGIGGLLARTHPGNKHFYYHADANGNVTAIVNQNQTLVAQYRYDPFGGLVSQSGPLGEGNLYRFSSKEFHQASGLYYYGYRFYDPNLQRWLNRDPIKETGGINLYRFIENDPVGHYDTLGLFVSIGNNPIVEIVAPTRKPQYKTACDLWIKRDQEFPGHEVLVGVGTSTSKNLRPGREFTSATREWVLFIPEAGKWSQKNAPASNDFSKYTYYSVYTRSEGTFSEGKGKGQPCGSSPSCKNVKSCLDKVTAPGTQSSFCGLSAYIGVGDNCRTSIDDALRKCCARRGDEWGSAPK